MNLQRKRIVLILPLISVLLAGCSTPPPAGVNRFGVTQTYKQINTSTLSSSRLSSYSQIVIHRYNLNQLYKQDILECIDRLHTIAEQDRRNDIRLALAELSFQAAQERRAYKSDRGVITRKACYVASAFYSYQYITRMSAPGETTAFSRQFRLGCDIYNRSLSAALAEKGSDLKKTHAELLLPVGSLTIAHGFYGLPLPIEKYRSFEPADIYTVRGLSTRIRNGGIGAPLIAIQDNPQNLPIGTVSPATVFLRIEGDLAFLRSGGCRALVELLNPLSQQSVMINDLPVPLEIDMTTQLAYTLERTDLWDLGAKMFRLGRLSYPPDIYPEHAYEKGKIPVVLVHGTMSSFVWWCEMLNTLCTDPEISNNFQFWLYLYDTGKPIIFSAGELRAAINRKILEYDPQNLDPAMQNMVLIGHSQGGLLCRFMTVDTGEEIVKTITGKSIAELDITDKDKQQIREYTVKKPMPCIKRVVFMSTPHRGSFRAGSLARKLSRWFIRIPQSVIETVSSLDTILSKDPAFAYIRTFSTSVDSMSPDNKALLAVAELPVPDGIRAHSIIAIDGDEQPPEGDDGVVKYRSAHLEGVESELVIRSGHSSQLQPAAIEEVRRILLTHLTVPIQK